jgi:hypothetical protein
MKLLALIPLFLVCITLPRCSQNIANNKSYTFDVKYAYWWPSGGPFVGMCGDSYSLVFTGIITKINKPYIPYTINNDSTAVLYTPQEGIIEINDIKISNPPKKDNKNTPNNNIDNEKFFKSDCFYHLNLKEGDKVIVFVYSYEGEYCIPNNSILKINDFDDPVVLSIENYIKNNQNPLFIKADTAIWSKYKLDSSLKQIIDCRLSTQNDN